MAGVTCMRPGLQNGDGFFQRTVCHSPRTPGLEAGRNARASVQSLFQGRTRYWAGTDVPMAIGDPRRRAGW